MSIHLADRGLLVLDAGTGIRTLGKVAAAGHDDLFILLSHAHRDHIHGFPFFDPISQPGRNIVMFPSRLGPTSICGLCQTAKDHGADPAMCPLLEQMDGEHFPVHAARVPSQPRCVHDDEIRFLRASGFAISRIAINHPGGGFGYRIEHEGASVVYLTDNELDPPCETTTAFDGFVDFCRNADVLIHDAQHVEADMPRKPAGGTVSSVRSAVSRWRPASGHWSCTTMTPIGPTTSSMRSRTTPVGGSSTATLASRARSRSRDCP